MIPSPPTVKRPSILPARLSGAPDAAELLNRRIVLLTGKGGVGKTTLTAALARLAASEGRRVLCAEVTSDAQAPSRLAEALGASSITEHPREVAPRIKSALLTASVGHHQFLRHVLPVKMLADAAMRSSHVRRFLNAAPTLAELGVLYRMLDLLRERRADGTFEHELLIIDLPATGHALALAQLPAALLEMIPGGPIGTAVREGLEVLSDPTRTGCVIVTLPEMLPVSEALELSKALHEHRVPLAGVIVNRVPTDPFSREERSHIRDLVHTHGPMLGGRTVERFERARHALHRLDAHVSSTLVAIPELLDPPSLSLAEAISMVLSSGPKKVSST